MVLPINLKNPNKTRSIFLKVLLILLGIFVGAVLILAIQRSRPGDFLYGLKRRIEEIVSSFMKSPEAITADNLYLADERMREVAYLMATDPNNSGSSMSLTLQEAGSEGSTINVSDSESSGTGPSGSNGNSRNNTVTFPEVEPDSFMDSVADGAERMMDTATSTETWNWIADDGTPGFLDQVADFANDVLNTASGVNTTNSSASRSSAQNDADIQSLLVDYNGNLNKVTDSLSQLQQSGQTPQTEDIAYEVASRLVAQRGILERASVDSNKSTADLINAGLISLDRNNKMALTSVPQDRRSQIIENVQFLNPNVEQHINDLVKTSNSQVNTVQKIDLNSDIEKQVREIINTEHVGTSVLPVTGIDVEEQTNKAIETVDKIEILDRVNILKD